MNRAAIEDRLRKIVAEATELRGQVPKYPGSGDPPAVWLEGLRSTRQLFDRVESLLVETVRIRAAADRAKQLAHEDTEHAWDAAATRHGGVSRDAGARERYAHFRLDSRSERLVELEASVLASRATEAHEILRTFHRSLGDVRSDHHVGIRAFQVESALER